MRPFQMEEPVAAANTTNHNEPVATEPLRRVGTQRELNAETVVDKDYAEDDEYEEDAEKDQEDDKYTAHHTGGRSNSSSAASTRTDATQSTNQLERVESKIPVSKWRRWLTLRSSHIPPVPKERTVSREAGAGILSIYSFQWMQPLMNVGYQRTLELNDIWLVNPKRSSKVLSEKVNASFKRRVARRDKRPLLGAMHETFKFEFWLGAVCQFFVSIIQVLNPFLLRYIISFAGEAYYARLYQRPGPHIGHGVGLVIAVTILQTIQSGCTNQFMYRGMMNGGQARSVLISLIFDKSMKISGRARAGGKAPHEDKAELPSGVSPGSKEEKKWFQKLLPKKSKAKKNGKDGKDHDQTGWSNGRIINLMSVDTYRIDQASGMFHIIWASPISIVLTLILLIVNISYSALAGFGLIFLLMPLLGRSIKSLFARRKQINKVTDQRVSLTQEILQAVRFVKYFGWETSFLERIESIRRREITSIQWLMAVRNAINAVAMSTPIFASMLSFICYSLTSHNLSPALIFSSLALFNSIRLPLNFLPLVIGQVVDASNSVERIQEFLMAEEANDECEWIKENINAVDVKNASFTWEQNTKADEKEPGKKATKQEKKDMKHEKKMKKDQDKRDKKEARRMSKLGIDPHNEKGDSQDTLAEPAHPFEIKDLDFSVGRRELIAIIGGVGSGKSSLLAALAGDMRKTSGHVVMGATRAFCPQSAWIQNATVKENIIFGKDFDRSWYNEVVDACALRADLEMLPSGDATEIGERGITVSGGQKQRLNIARAIYFNSEIVLMDDPLSAVDAHVGRHIMDHAICGLLSEKCRILATHQLWVLNRCDRIIWMEDGRIIANDTFDNLMENNSDFKTLIASNAQEEEQDEEGKVNDDEVAAEKKHETKHHGGKKPTAALMQAEERAVSNVSWEVYKAYIKAAGSLLVFPLLMFLLILSQGINIVTSLWLSWWTGNKFGYPKGLYIGGYAALGAGQALFMFIFSVALSYFGTNASKVMLHRAMTQVLRAPMSFFDTTPLGRITNRFSKDVDTMDNVLIDAIRFFAFTFSQIIAVFILIMVYYYYFAVALVPLFIIFLFSANYYRASAREIKRHEAVLRSSVFARFSEGVSGISTIRAYGLQKHFSEEIQDSIDNMNSAYFLTFSNQRWLSVRLDFIGNILVFVVGILVVTSRFTVSPSTGGLVLSYILSIVMMIQFTVRQLAEVENNMNSTERIHYYGTKLEEEPPLHLKSVPESWPERGEIVFENVEMRYRDGLPLVLRGLSMHVKGGERIGVVGRTGAGKSSIMSTIFRLVELSGGSITIDGININTIGLSDLRSRLAIIPQDPTLFRGTVRSNLDPFNRYTDLELWSALRQADLVGDDTAMDDKTSRIQLDSPVEEEGQNFSLGQRQLMALARALVRGSQIIVCDEATSSVDMDTDQKIQKTIMTGFKGKTLLCIAHRLKTIIHYDRICVMDQGRIVELDTPRALFEREGGIFRGMCDRSHIRRDDFDPPAAASEEDSVVRGGGDDGDGDNDAGYEMQRTGFSEDGGDRGVPGSSPARLGTPASRHGWFY